MLLLAAAQQSGLLTTLTNALTTLTPEPNSRLLQLAPAHAAALLQTLLFLPAVGLKRPWDLRTYTDPTLALLSGRPSAYGYRAVERFLGELAASAAAQPLSTALAGWTVQLWPQARQPFYYIDGHRKAVYTDVAIPRGLIGRTGKILGCRALALLHDSAGHPLLVLTQRGDTHLTQLLPALVEQYQQAAGLQQPLTYVVDREAMSGLFLAERVASGQTVITLLRANQYQDEGSFSAVGPWQPLLYGPDGQVLREVAAAHFELKVPSQPQSTLPLSVALIRDQRCAAQPAGAGLPAQQNGATFAGATALEPPAVRAATLPAGTARLVPIVSTAPSVDPLELVGQYTARWAQQENIIRDWLLPLGLDTNHGYSKQPVVNSETEKQREQLRGQLERVRGRCEQAQASRARAEEAYTARLQRAEERRAAQERKLRRCQIAVAAQAGDDQEQQRRLRAAEAAAEQEMECLLGRVARARQVRISEREKLAHYSAQEDKLKGKLAALAVRERPMYELNNEADQVMSVLKLGLANLGMWVRDEYFPGSYAGAGWLRLAPFFKLAGRISELEGEVQVELRGFNDRALNRDLGELCQRVSAARPQLPDGRALVLRLAGPQRFGSESSINRLA